MPIASTDLLLYGAASRPENDTDPSGGAIDTQYRPVFMQLLANSTLAYVSSASDTRDVTVVGRDPTGAQVSEQVTLTGTSVVSGSQVFERILKATVSASGAQTVTIGGSGVGNLGQIPATERGFFAMFIASASDETPLTRYEKMFARNSHATLTLNSAAITLTADPSSVLEIGLAASKNDTTSVANRLAAPGGVSFVGVGVAQNVPGTTLEAASRIGIWVKQALAANNPPIRNYFTTRIAGTTV